MIFMAGRILDIHFQVSLPVWTVISRLHSLFVWAWSHPSSCHVFPQLTWLSHPWAVYADTWLLSPNFYLKAFYHSSWSSFGDHIYLLNHVTTKLLTFFDECCLFCYEILFLPIFHGAKFSSSFVSLSRKVTIQRRCLWLHKLKCETDILPTKCKSTYHNFK